ncbi:MAG: TonB-dependent receptor plug domain-containing protein [Bacteroidota bacterium]
MRTKVANIILFLSCFTQSLFAQHQDTLVLPAAEIIAERPLLFSIGNSTTLLDSAFVATSQGNNLGELLSQQSALFVKTYGAGGSSTLSSRGTEARHTAVFWNGLNISSPTLGLNDLSLTPVSFCDRILIVRGGSCAINGSSSIGGSVHLLPSEPVFEKRSLFSASADAGSFGIFNTSLSSQWAGKFVESKTQAFYGTAHNNFKFINKASRDFPEQKLANAGYSGFGIMQDLRFKTGNDQYAGLSAWYQTLSREIPPLMTDPSSEATQSDSSLRLVGTYKINKHNWGVHANGGIFYEHQRYEDPEYSINTYYPSRTLTGDIEWRRVLSRSFIISAGSNYAASSAKFAEYGTDLRRRELFSIYSGIKFNHVEKLKAQLNFRKEMLYANAPSFTPQLGLEASIYKNVVILFSSIGRNYHIPSMNDLYWVPGGNPDLLAEDAWNAELGLELKLPTFEKTKIRINAFGSKTENWIRWQPTTGGIYAPDNLRKVETKGGELLITHRQSFRKSIIDFTAEYSFVSSCLIETYHASEFHLLGNQLMYIPNHKATAGVFYKRGNTSVVINHSFTGSRYTDADNTQWLDGYVLADLRLEHWLELNRSAVAITAGLFNLYNTEYQIMPYRPTPGRWFTVGLKFTHANNK